MNPRELYEFLPIVLITEVGYLIFAFLHWRFARKQLPRQATSLVYCLIAVQFILIFMHAWTFEWADLARQRFWNINWEHNAPATFSTVQMALVGAAALVLSGIGNLSLTRRAYVLVSGALFLLFAYDEYLLLHERFGSIRKFYVAYGILFVLISLILANHARRSSKRSFYLYLWSAFGISLAGFGAFTLEAFNYPCLKQLGFATDYCLRSYPLEEALENLGTLFILLGIFSEMKRAIPRAKARRVSEICLLLLVLWLGVLRTVYWYSRNKIIVPMLGGMLSTFPWKWTMAIACY